MCHRRPATAPADAAGERYLGARLDAGGEVAFSGRPGPASWAQPRNSREGSSRAPAGLVQSLLCDISREGRILVGPRVRPRQNRRTPPPMGEEGRPRGSTGRSPRTSRRKGVAPVSGIRRGIAGGTYNTLSSSARRVGSRAPWRGESLALSSDEKWALVSRRRPSHLALLPTGAGEPRDLSGGQIQSNTGHSSFRTDGGSLSRGGEGPPPRTYIQDVKGGPPRPFGEEGLRILLASPDGRQLAPRDDARREGLLGSSRRRRDDRPAGRSRGRARRVPCSVERRRQDSVRPGVDENPLTLYRVDLETGKKSSLGRSSLRRREPVY